jgi:hypothetical protein
MPMERVLADVLRRDDARRKELQAQLDQECETDCRETAELPRAQARLV